MKKNSKFGLCVGMCALGLVIGVVFAQQLPDPGYACNGFWACSGTKPGTDNVTGGACQCALSNQYGVPMCVYTGNDYCSQYAQQVACWGVSTTTGNPCSTLYWGCYPPQ